MDVALKGKEKDQVATKLTARCLQCGVIRPNLVARCIAIEPTVGKHFQQLLVQKNHVKVLHQLFAALNQTQ